MRIKQYLVLILVLFAILTSSAQTTNQNPLQSKVGFTILFEHINLPFEKRLGNKRHIGVVLNYTLSKERDRLFQVEHNFNLGYFKHKKFFQAAFINYKPSFGVQLGNAFRLSIPVGVGYAFSMPTQRSYHQVDGTFAKSKLVGKSHFMPSLGLGANLNMSKMLGIPMEVFTQYEMFSLAPYAPNGSLPFTVHTSTNFGLKYRLK